MRSTNVLILTPLALPAVGGAAIYTEVLARELVSRQSVNSVTVLTEAYPGQPAAQRLLEGKITIRRVFPYRAGRPDKKWTRYALYLWQNIQFLRLRDICRRLDISILFVHGSFHNNPNSLGWVVKQLRKTEQISVIADLRDPKLPARRTKQLLAYHKIVACSENIRARLQAYSQLYDKTTLIPIIIDVKRPSPAQINNCLVGHKLQGVRYVFFASGISREKGIDRLIEVVSILRQTDPTIVLAVAGKRRDWNVTHQNALASGWLRYLGTVPHHEVLCLAAGSLLDMNLSRVDSMPRASLESLAVGARVLLPPGVPEFDARTPQTVAQGEDPVAIARQARAVIDGHVVSSYDLSVHTVNHVLPMYERLISEFYAKPAN